ncbi:ABC transporter [Boletus reticuloceps]|uniref:ABC transporter n=1 Tax=Boletus reticuloceps TaxID=495285 RepID=A0A8I2Z3A8_9AGAM|nr:ABC transporter [Boletus reticuloceps]
MWLTPLLSLGFARPLEASDLYKLPDDHSSTRVANAILTSFERRRKEAAIYNKRLANGQVGPGVKSLWWSIRGVRAEQENVWRENDGKRKASLVLALNDSVKWHFWSAGILKVIGDTAQVTSPLVVKEIISFAAESYAGHITGIPTPPIATGVVLSVALFALQLIASWSNQHFIYRSTACGILLRGGLITAIYSRALSLSPRARVQMTNGRLVNHISTDVSRIDFCLGYFTCLGPHQSNSLSVSFCSFINLGPSALAGFAFLVPAISINTIVANHFFSIRIKSMAWTDKRSKLLQEILSGIRVIKFFSWEIPFSKRISEYRKLETVHTRTLLFFRAGLSGFAFSLPTLAAVITFITYSMTGHSLSAANVFSSLTLFQLIRVPLLSLPMALGSIVDASAACKRLYEVFEAETSDETVIINKDLGVAVRIADADFTWDGPPTRYKDPNIQPVDMANIFALRGVDMEIPRSKLVAIVGAVGAGKTSLLQGIIGEMRWITGTVELGGTVAYCAQTAWIQNATIRENICFGRPFEEDRYWKAVRDSCLESDLQMLPDYDLTEVGEKGISLSGGQKQRVNICRAIYFNSDVVILDDPFSALDAHVGRAVFGNILKGGTAGKTRILVTHALHFLPEVDYIYTLVDGKIAEHGTFEALMASDGAFCKLMETLGSRENNNKNSVEKIDIACDEKKGRNVNIKGKATMQEERNTGAIPLKMYWEYLSAGNGMIVVPIVFLTLVLLQVSNVMSSYWLVYWEEVKWNYPQGFYMGIYAVLGVSQSLATFFTGVSFAIMTFHASQELHKVVSTTSVHIESTHASSCSESYCQHIDTIDNLICESFRTLSLPASGIVGAIVLITIVLPWFILVAFCILVCYLYPAFFYRASARELKRLDAILRDSLYAHFSESLSGLTTISAYGETDRFRKENIELVDIENRAYWLTIASQRWLAMRLDLLGAILTLAVATLTVGTRFSISPGRTGMVLSYILMAQQNFGWTIRQAMDVENNMNSVERIVHYANELEQEPRCQIKDSTAPPPSWPFEGRIVMKDIFMEYRPDLPPVLKGLSMDIASGEKIGIVGRTGAGKSSIMTALYRLVELSSGSIQIDDVDISKVGLEQLRKGLAIIPQDAVSPHVMRARYSIDMFFSSFVMLYTLIFERIALLTSFPVSGTLRDNLDPFGLYDEARLWDALKRAHLVDTDEEQLRFVSAMYPCNLSVGQRALVSLARALVHETKILILDEATASVDYETDGKIQNAIATEFKNRTILCIAHRLRTVISYDRICVLNAGTIVEFDTPANLFEIPDGIFRGMCDRSSISLEDILSTSSMSPVVLMAGNYNLFQNTCLVGANACPG